MARDKQVVSDLLFATSLFIITLWVYLRTLCPTIYWGDCGELAASAYLLGNTHPTGYPLWLLAAKSWSILIPHGSIIWRMNTLSAVIGSCAVILLYGYTRLIGARSFIAAACAGLFAFSHTFWQQCLFAETYSLTAFFTCLLLFLTARWHKRGHRQNDLCQLGLAVGFALTNGQINVLFVPGIVIYVLISHPELRELNKRDIRLLWTRVIASAVPPLLLYLYLPIRALAHPAVNWGDQRTLYGFYYHVSARPYMNKLFIQPPGVVIQHLWDWTIGLGLEFPWPFLAVAGYGIFSLLRQKEKRALGVLFCWIMLIDVGFTANYFIYNAYIYLIAWYVIIASAAALGLEDMAIRLGKVMNQERRPALTMLVAAAMPALVFLQCTSHWKQLDLSTNWTCLDYGRNILSTMPMNGLLIDNGTDESKCAITYLQNVDGYRRDVVYVSRGMVEALYDFRCNTWENMWIWRQIEEQDPDVRALYPGNHITQNDVLSEDPIRRLIAQAIHTKRSVLVLRPTRLPIFFDENYHLLTLYDYLNTRYDTAPIGVLTQVFKRYGKPSAASLETRTRSVWQGYQLRGVYDGLYANDPFLEPIAIDYFDAGMARALIDEATGHYIDAAESYSSVQKLFNSQAAAEGEARCSRLASTSHSPISSRPVPIRTAFIKTQ